MAVFPVGLTAGPSACTASMTMIRSEIEVHCTLADAWAFLIDFERMPEWFLGEKHVTVYSKPPSAGTERDVTLFVGHTFRERFVEWKEQCYFRLVVLNPPRFVRQWEARVSVRLTEHTVRVCWILRYSFAFHTLGRLFDACMAAPVIRFVLSVSLSRFKAMVERNRVVGRWQRPSTDHGR